jgi:biopolymer transport protein ExbB
MSWDLVEMWHSMSFIPRAVVFTLVFMSVYCFATGIERAIVFSKAKKQSRDLLKLISGLWREGKIEESVKLSADKRFKNSHLAKVLVAGLNELQFQQDSRSGHTEVVDSAKRAIERATIKGVQEFKRGLNGLATIGSTGPFIGLFGTVFGIITAFQGMKVSGSGGIGAVAGGIAEALVTTAFGIGVAIIALWCFNVLNARVEVYNAEMTNTTSQVVDFFIRATESK